MRSILFINSFRLFVFQQFLQNTYIYSFEITSKYIIYSILFKYRELNKMVAILLTATTFRVLSNYASAIIIVSEVLVPEFKEPQIRTTKSPFSTTLDALAI